MEHLRARHRGVNQKIAHSENGFSLWANFQYDGHMFSRKKNPVMYPAR